MRCGAGFELPGARRGIDGDRISRRAAERRVGAEVPSQVIDGKIFPLHPAVSRDWKVHYFTAAMADNATHRAEERRFLEDMPGALDERAMAALAGIGAELGLDYRGVDFGIDSDGSVLLFEANAAMVVIAPPPEPIWDCRRRPVADIPAAAKQPALSRARAAGRLSGLPR